MAKAKVVVADSTVSALQMMDFWRKVGDGSIDGPLFQSFLANPRRFAKADKSGKTTLTRAINILGDQKVIGPTEASVAQTITYGFDAIAPVHYSEADLKAAAESNKAGLTNFYLVYVFGVSLRNRRAHFGVNTNQQPCFYNTDWWMKAAENGWAEATAPAGYYLLDFKGRFASMTWQAQEDEITKLGPDYERANEIVVAEAALTIFKVKNVRVMPDWYHWGRSVNSDGDRVCVGRFDTQGLLVLGYHPSYFADHLRVVVARKFQN